MKLAANDCTASQRIDPREVGGTKANRICDVRDDRDTRLNERRERKEGTQEVERTAQMLNGQETVGTPQRNVILFPALVNKSDTLLWYR